MSSYTQWRDDLLNDMHTYSSFAWKASLGASIIPSLLAVVFNEPSILIGTAGFVLMAAWCWIAANWLT